MSDRPEEAGAPVSQDAIRMAGYSYRIPSPPSIPVPIPTQQARATADYRSAARGGGGMELVPALEHVDPKQISGAHLDIILRRKTQRAQDAAKAAWRYEQRHQAQPVLDFLYVGPWTAVADDDFLGRQAITMVLVGRDARFKGINFLSVERAASALGIQRHYLDIEGYDALVRTYPEAVRLINEHMLAVHQSLGPAEAATRHGKVLLACESGNDYAASLAAAYIMAMFGQSMVRAIQFTSMHRFCCTFGESVKRSLLVWEDILMARRVVAWGPSAAQQRPLPRSQMRIDMDWETWQPDEDEGRAAKRGIDDVAEAARGEGQEDMAIDGQGNPTNDVDRFVDRAVFAPFRDGVGVAVWDHLWDGTSSPMYEDSHVP